jgi:hypothetical protein
VIGYRVGLMALDHDLLAKSALNVREGHGAAVKAHVQAVVVLAGLAVAAMAAGPRGRDGDALPAHKPTDFGPPAVDDARDLVAQGQGLADAHRAKAAVLVVVQVRAADATESDFNAQLLVAQRRQFGGFDAQVLG